MKDEKSTRKEQNREKNNFNPMCKLFETEYIRRAVKEILEELLLLNAY